MPQSSSQGSVLLGVSFGLLATSAALAGTYAIMNKGGDTAIAARSPVIDTSALRGEVDKLLDKDVDLMVDGKAYRKRWRELGVNVLEAELPRASGSELATLAGRGALPVGLDRAKAVAALTELKHQSDRAPSNAIMDLEARTIRDDVPGFGVDVFGSLGPLEAAARSGAAQVQLTAVAIPARLRRDNLGISDISHVLGTFQTKFAVNDKDRNFNLKLAASKLNGHVILPGAEFSFNGVVGDRTEKEGYKVAHVITAGEMVDGLAGGTCQISTTLFGASFFAGLEVVKSLPHSRPSTYVPMGLDSTVVWPHTDLVLKNPYDFPVVIHYRVARGEAQVEILGKERPYDQVAFEREVQEETPFTTQERPDETLPEGYTTLDQPGFNGYKLIRYRKFYKGKKLVKTDKWTLLYKPVTEYVRRGTSVDPMTPFPESEKEHHMPKAPKNGTGRIVQ